MPIKAPKGATVSGRSDRASWTPFSRPSHSSRALHHEERGQLAAIGIGVGFSVVGQRNSQETQNAGQLRGGKNPEEFPTARGQVHSLHPRGDFRGAIYEKRVAVR